jgi:integrase
VLAYSGLRIGEGLPLTWKVVNWHEEIIDVKRKKRGIFPWVPILPEMKQLLLDMRARLEAANIETDLLFPSPFDPSKYRDHSAYRSRLTAACKALGIGHVTPHGLRSYFVTQARQSGLTDAEIAMLIGDKSGPTLIASTYGDVRSEHLVRQAQRIKLRVGTLGELHALRSCATSKVQ